MHITQPIYYCPTSGLQANVPVIGYTLAAFWIDTTVPWPKMSGLGLHSSTVTGNSLIKVRRLDEDHALDTHKHLQQCRFARLPILLGRSRPGSQK